MDVDTRRLIKPIWDWLLVEVIVLEGAYSWWCSSIFGLMCCYYAIRWFSTRQQSYEGWSNISIILRDILGLICASQYLQVMRVEGWRSDKYPCEDTWAMWCRQFEQFCFPIIICATRACIRITCRQTWLSDTKNLLCAVSTSFWDWFSFSSQCLPLWSKYMNIKRRVRSEGYYD